MSDAPRFGQRAPQQRQEKCTKHPGSAAVSYCKRCNRPACMDCSIPTEVGSICTDCAGTSGRKKAASLRASWQSSKLAQMPVTVALIVLNVLVFVAEKIFPSLFYTLAFSPVAAFFEPWRGLTSAFLHAGIMHLGMNMLMLYLLGSSVERVLGWWRYLSVYLLSAAGGSMLITTWAAFTGEGLNTATVGASGAIYGLFGAIFVLQRRSGVPTRSILVLLAVNLAFSFTFPNISWQGHLGGFFLGLLSTFAFATVTDKFRRKGRKAVTIASVLTLVALVLIVAGGTWGLNQLLWLKFGV